MVSDDNTATDLTGSETTVEAGQGADTPDTTDNVDNSAANDTTSNTANDDASVENYLGNFKTREDAENGFKSAQAKITEQGNRIKELEAKINKSDAPQMLDVKKEVATVQQKINTEYSERLQGLGVKYSSYLPDDVEVNSIDDIVANLPSQAAAKFMSEFKDIQAEYNEKLNKGIDSVYKEANTKFEELKAADKERYKDNETVFNAWYNPPKTIEELSELVATVKKQAIEEYIKEQAAQAEDAEHKGKLANGASGSKNKYGDDHIFTRQELKNMSDKEFAKYERVISEQVAKGLVV